MKRFCYTLDKSRSGSFVNFFFAEFAHALNADEKSNTGFATIIKYCSISSQGQSNVKLCLNLPLCDHDQVRLNESLRELQLL